MENSKKISILNELKKEINKCEVNLFMCNRLKIMETSKYITYEERKILITELWEDKVIETVWDKISKIPSRFSWYNRNDKESRIKNIDITIKRLKEKKVKKDLVKSK